MDTDRNLLFGVLAFQKGAIDADRLAETCAISGDATVSLPDQLVDRGWLTVDQKQELERTLADELTAHGGDPGATLAGALDGRCLEALRNAGQLDPALEARMTIAHQPAGPVLLGALGTEEGENTRTRYTLSHLYAKGGMGQVWLAHDPELGREIALKELRPDQSENSEVCSRFLAEARVTAQLEHPGIVPVYELGEGDAPYYTMRFIKGGTLSQATRAYHKDRVAGSADPLGLLKLLGAFIGVCNAVGYAHSRGVIHRDLKGQNVVLGDFGEVIVLDWGLAKRIAADARPGQADAGAPPAGGVSLNGVPTHGGSGVGVGLDVDATLPPDRDPRSGSASRPRIESGAGPEGTLAGQLLGTPAYMAPEQAEGRQRDTDPRTDVYGLGAILYEVLTGQPPFHAKTTNELLRKVRKEAPPPPRQVNPEVAPALQAVCLKALSKAPEARYASAVELAKEVQRYLADEPVLAYPEPWTRRAARWARKHRTSVAAAAGLLVAATAALAVSTALIARERNEARTQGEQARTAVDDMYTKVAENWLEDRLDPLQKEFLEKTLNYYEKFTGFAAGTPAVRLEHARAYRRMGEIHRKLGRFDEAEKAFRKALSRLEPLAAGAAATPDAGRELAATRTRLGDLLFRNERFDQAEGLFKEAVAALEPLAAGAAATGEDRTLLARAVRSEAELLRRKGDLHASRPVASRAVELLEQVLKADPQSAEARYDLAQAHDFAGRVARDLGDGAAYEHAFRRAYELLNPLVAGFPTMPRYREAMAHVCNGLGNVERESGRTADCEAHWRRMLAEAERLAQDFPDRPEYQRLLAGAQSNVGGILAEQDRFDEAEPILRRGIERNTALLAKSPNDPEVRFDLATCTYNLGYLEFKKGRTEAAVATLERARDLLAAMVKESPAIPRNRRLLGMALSYRAEALDALGRPGAADAYRECLDVVEKLAGEFPDNVYYQIELARCLNKMAGHMANAGHTQEAEDLYNRGLAVLDAREPGDGPDERLREKAMILSNLGVLRQEAKRPDIEKPLRESLAIAQAMAKAKPESRKDRQFLAVARNNLGEALAEAGKNDAAAEQFRESLASLEQIVAKSPESLDDQFFLAHVAEQQGKLLAATGKLADARLAFEKAVTHEKQAVKLSGGKIDVYRSALAEHLAVLADVCIRLADFNAAVQAAVDLARAAPDAGMGHFEAARILARAASAVEGDARLASARKEELIRRCLGRTVVMLREAIDANTKLTDRIKDEPAFKRLLDRPEFQAMLNSLVGLSVSGRR